MWCSTLRLGIDSTVDFGLARPEWLDGPRGSLDYMI